MARYIATPEVPTGFANRCVYSTPGTYTFTVPSGVTSIKAIAVGGGSAGSDGFIEGATVSTQVICNMRAEVRGTLSGCCCYNHIVESCLNGSGCSKFCLPELKTCYYAYAGSGGGYAEKTITVSPGDTFAVTVADVEETSSFGTEISASGAQQPTLTCSALFDCQFYCTGNLPLGCTTQSVCCCCSTGYRCITTETVACSRAYCVQSYSGNNISAITHRPGTGTGGDKNYTGGCGQDTSIISDEIEYGISCFNSSYWSNCCTGSYLMNPCQCIDMRTSWQVNQQAACRLPFNTSFWSCVGGFCDYSCFDNLRGCDVYNCLCTCLLKDFIKCFTTCNKTHAINTWYGNCENAFESRCKPQNDNIPCKFSSSGDLRAEVEMSYSGPSSGSPIGDGKPGACAQFIGVGPSTTTAPNLHYCVIPECYTSHFFKVCGCNNYCKSSECCWGKHPWYAKPEQTLPHFYEHMIDFTTDASTIDCHRPSGTFPGCLALNENVFCYLEYKVPCRCWYWQNGIEKGVPPAGCSGVGDKGSYMGPNQMWSCNGNCFGGETCDGWTKATGFRVSYCGMHYCTTAGCGTWYLTTPYHLKGTELGVDGTCGCTYDQCLRCCAASCIQLCHFWCNGQAPSQTCSCYCTSCVAAGLNNTCLLKPCTTIEQWVCYTVPNPFVRVATLCMLNRIPNLRNHFQASLTALTFLDSKRYGYYCNGTMYCACCSPCFNFQMLCTDPSISCCHCCASSYSCGQWFCNTQGNQVCKGTATDIVLPGSAGGPGACGNIPCQVTGAYYTTGPGADPSGVDIPKFISTGGGSSVMSQDTFNKIMHEYDGNAGAWYLRECWAFKCDLYAEGGTTCCCNCCIRPLSHMDCGYCCCRCAIGTHFGYGCANMCFNPHKCAAVCYSFKLYACMMAELIRKQGMSFECIRNTSSNGTSQADCATVTAVINVGSASGLYINSVSNNFVGQKTCLSGGGSSVTKYYAPMTQPGDGAFICGCSSQNCGPCWANNIRSYSQSSTCVGHFTACLDDSTERECKFTVVPCVCCNQCKYCFLAPDLFCGCIAPGISENYCYNQARQFNACGYAATPMVASSTSGGGSGSSPYVPEIYSGPKLDDEYLFSTSECIVGGSPQICIQGSSTTIAPGYSQGGGKSGCMGPLCNQQIITNNAYNGGIFPRGTPGFGGGGTICGNGGTGLVVVYWN